MNNDLLRSIREAQNRFSIARTIAIEEMAKGKRSKRSWLQEPVADLKKLYSELIETEANKLRIDLPEYKREGAAKWAVERMAASIEAELIPFVLVLPGQNREKKLNTGKIKMTIKNRTIVPLFPYLLIGVCYTPDYIPPSRFSTSSITARELAFLYYHLPDELINGETYCAAGSTIDIPIGGGARTVPSILNGNLGLVNENLSKENIRTVLCLDRLIFT